MFCSVSGSRQEWKYDVQFQWDKEQLDMIANKSR